jgi:hypothetical protein
VSAQDFEPRALAGKTQLQHLTLGRCRLVPGAGVAQLLSELQHLTQLSHLELSHSCRWFPEEGGPSPPPAAYASLTASSRLQHLDFSSNTLPSAAWQYMCPAGRTPPQLTHLDISYVTQPSGTDASALVSCCPGLQILKSSIPCSTAKVAPLQQLTGLHTLAFCKKWHDELEGVEVLCQLTGLRELELRVTWVPKAQVLKLTRLTSLTALTFPPHCVQKQLRSHPQVS